MKQQRDGKYRKSGNSKIKNIKALYESRQIQVIKFFNDYSEIVSEAKYKTIYKEGLKILTPTQMPQRLPIVLAQVKVGNTCENLLNKIRQIIYSLYRAKEITKKVYSNIMSSIKLRNRMDTIFVNSKSSGIPHPLRLSILNLKDNINLKRK